MTYAEFKKKTRERIDSLPIFYAFNTKQYDEAIKKRNLAGKEIISIGAGAFCCVDDYDVINKTFSSTDELSLLLENVEFFEEALKYELWNHEFEYTDDPTDALDVLNLKKEDLEKLKIKGSKLANKMLKYL